MLKSMTGYGRAKAEDESREIAVEIRSVNHRYLDLTIKTPRVYSFLEDKVKAAVNGKVSRGKVDVFVSVKSRGGSDIQIAPNHPVVDGYLTALRDIAERHGLESDVTAAVIARLPDVFTTEREQTDESELTGAVLAVFENALLEYTQMRQKEGDALCADVLARADLILGFLAEIERLSPLSVDEYREKLSVRMTELLGDSEIAQQRILSEAAFFADRVSVTEEIVRLRSHLEQFGLMMRSQTPVGRKLDFLVQELNREANTIGSKANFVQISQIVVDMKAEIEKIREQVQNLE